MKLDRQRLEEIRAESNGHPLFDAHADWRRHEQEIIKALPNFAVHNMYQAQHQSEEAYARALDRAIKGVLALEPTDLDKEYGARCVKIRDGEYTRQFIDSHLEMQFLERHLPMSRVGVLDIGAGYGRLARFLSKLYVRPVVYPLIYTVDAIPVSTWLCESYCTGTNVETLTLKQFEARYTTLDIDLVVNIHSWNECTYDQVARWLEYVQRTKALYLFTVTYNYYKGITYHTNQPDHKSFRPLIEKHFTQITEEDVSIHAGCPLTLWRRK